jgi:cytochrome c oxidase subunit 4
LQALRAKEKEDWKKLSVQEKKAIYRASFCQTFAEMQYPKGEWKQHVGAVLIVLGLACYISLWTAGFSKSP